MESEITPSPEARSLFNKLVFYATGKRIALNEVLRLSIILGPKTGVIKELAAEKWIAHLPSGELKILI